VVTRVDGDEIYNPDSRLLAKIQPQLDHATWHGWTPVRWRVGATALDSHSPVLTEDVTALMGVPVEIDCTLGRNVIRLVAE
jgi:hypothetical protein